MCEEKQRLLRVVSHQFTNWLLIVVCLVSGFSWWRESNKREAEAQEFALATRSASAGRWFYDLKAEARHERQSLRWDETMFKVFGKDPKKWSPDYGGFESCLIEDDRPIIRQRVNAAIVSKTGYSAVMRVLGDDGKLRYIMAWAFVDPTGSFMTGICVPLTGEVYRDLYRVLPPTLEAPVEAEPVQPEVPTTLQGAIIIDKCPENTNSSSS
jgi:hypothetical protein